MRQFHQALYFARAGEQVVRAGRIGQLQAAAPGLDLVVDYGWLAIIAWPLFWLLEKFYALSGNWGVAIILLTVLVKVAVFFLNFRSQKSMRAFGAKMARVKPELDAIQTQFKEDPKRLQQEMMQLYRKHKMFPPLGGR